MNRIEINPKKLGGKPVIKGTRISIHLILKMLANGMDIKKILKEYPELTEEDIREAIRYASQILSREKFLLDDDDYIKKWFESKGNEAIKLIGIGLKGSTTQICPK